MKKGIAARIFWAMLGVALVPLTLIFWYITSRYSADLRTHMLEQNALTHRSQALALNEYLTKIEFISNTCFGAGMQQILKQQPGDALARYNTRAQIERSIRINLDLFRILDSVDLVCIFTEKGAVYPIGAEGYEPAVRAVLEQQGGALAGSYKHQALFSLAGQPGGTGKLMYARQINDILVEQQTVGMIAIVFDEARFGQALGDGQEGGAPVRVEAAGQLLYISPAAKGLAGELASARTMAGAKGSTGLVKSSYQTDTLGLTVNFYDDLSVLLAPLNRLRWVTSALIAASAAGILLCSWLLARGLVRPVRDLQKATLKVRDGDFDIQVQATTRDELGELCDSFNCMAQRIGFLVNEVYATQLSEKEAIIASLTSQINPHFLYNTLDMVKSMAELEGAEEISEVAMALSGLFRYSTKNDRLVVTVREELQNLNNYIRILQARFGGRVRFELEAGPDTLECEIMKVCLQPLVENAVSHGLSHKAQGGCVWVRVRREGGLLIVTARDDGVGMPPEALAALRQSLHAQGLAAQGEAAAGRVGLRNIQRRIQLYYGEGYGLAIESEEQKGTCVTVKLPARNGENRREE